MALLTVTRIKHDCHRRSEVHCARTAAAGIVEIDTHGVVGRRRSRCVANAREWKQCVILVNVLVMQCYLESLVKRTRRTVN